MTLLKWAVALLCLLCGPTQARELLPVALEHQSAGFYLDGTTARLPIGSRVEFIFKDEKGIPKKLPYVRGFVLGTHNNVVFFELTAGDAAQLAKTRALREVKYQKAMDPVDEEVKVRREYRDSGHSIRLAPQMRRLTVTMEVDREIVSKWSPGEILTFYDARKYKWSERFHDVQAIFRSATESEDGLYEVMVVADPNVAQDILRAELENRLNVDPDTEARRKEAGEKRCYVTRRAGQERIQIEIPCVN